MGDIERDTAALLFANDIFYRAFTDRDVDLMEQIWARRGPVTCIHPGWPPLEGREDVLQAWYAILTGEAAPAIECQGARAHVYGDSGLVICYERIGEDYLVAANLFVRVPAEGERTEWLMVHHQASPAPPPQEEPETAPGRIN